MKKKSYKKWILCEPDFVKQKHRARASIFLIFYTIDNDHTNYICNQKNNTKWICIKGIDIYIKYKKWSDILKRKIKKVILR